MNNLKAASALAAAFVLLSATVGDVQARPIAYPAKGQSVQKQQQDDSECYVWARNSTGIDPGTVSSASQGPAVGGGERLRGAARGAVGGAAIGAIAGDTGKGAGIGAVAGTMAGGVRARQNQQSTQQGAIDTYYRAHAACMEGRGYTIK